MTTDDELLDRNASANFLGFSTRTLDRVPDLPRVKLTARRVMYRKSDLLAWIESKIEHRAA